jgi:hypothetical protein
MRRQKQPKQVRICRPRAFRLLHWDCTIAHAHRVENRRWKQFDSDYPSNPPIRIGWIRDYRYCMSDGGISDA